MNNDQRRLILSDERLVVTDEAGRLIVIGGQRPVADLIVVGLTVVGLIVVGLIVVGLIVVGLIVGGL